MYMVLNLMIMSFFYFLFNSIIDICFYGFYSFEKTAILLVVFSILLPFLFEYTRKVENNKDEIYGFFFRLNMAEQKNKFRVKKKMEDVLVIEKLSDDQMWSKELFFIKIGYNKIKLYKNKIIKKPIKTFLVRDIYSPYENGFVNFINEWNWKDFKKQKKESG